MDDLVERRRRYRHPLWLRHPYTWGRHHPLVVDAGIATVLAVVTAVMEASVPTSQGHREMDGVSVMLTVAACLPLVVRRRYPVATFVLVGAVAEISGLRMYDGPGPWFALVVALYGMGAYAGRHRIVIALGYASVAIGFAALAGWRGSIDHPTCR
jgi:hypothetical protein